MRPSTSLNIYSKEIKGFENVNLDEMLHVPLSQINNLSFTYVIKNLIYCFCKTEFIVEKKGNGKLLLFFSPSYLGRKEYEEELRALSKCEKDSTLFFGSNKFELHFERLRYFVRWFSWNKQFRKCGYTLLQSSYLANKILEAKSLIDEIDGIIKKEQWNPDICVTFCDTHPIDYYLTYYFNSKGIKTATLQHAAYYHKTHGFEYSNSHSNYFLAVSEYALSEAKKSGYSNGNEIIVCGPLKYLLTDVNSTDSKLRNYKHSFGIALSGPSFLQTNDELVSYGKIIQNRFNLDMYVRPHPALSQDYIDSLLSETKYSISKGSMVEFANECNFVILGNTNTFADLIALGVPTFRMISSDGLDFFEEISDLKFTNEKELLNQVTLVGDDELNIIIEKWSDFVCPKWDIRERYISTFNKIMNKGDNSK